MLKRIPYSATIRDLYDQPSYLLRKMKLPELLWLIEIIGRTKGEIVEIGTFLGYTARDIALAYPNRIIHCVDIVNGEAGSEVCREAKNLQNVRLHLEGFDYLFPNDADFILIDGDHSETAIQRNTEYVQAHFDDRCGIAVWHDVHHKGAPVETDAHPGLLHYLESEAKYFCSDIICVDGTRFAFCEFNL